MIANFITFLVILATDIVNQVRRYGGGNFCTLPRYDRERKKRRNGLGILPITGPLCYFFLPRKRNRLYTYCNFTKNKWKIYSMLGWVYPDNYYQLLILLPNNIEVGVRGAKQKSRHLLFLLNFCSGQNLLKRISIVKWYSRYCKKEFPLHLYFII